VISPRRTTLIRTPDLAGFRAALATRVGELSVWSARNAFVLVPSAAAAEQLRRTIEDRLLTAERGTAERSAVVLPRLGTRAACYHTLASRLPRIPRLLSSFEREVILTAAARAAEAHGVAPPFRIRPGLIAEMLDLYDHIRRLGRSVADFERNFRGELESAVAFDRGAEKLLQQTTFLNAVFEDYEARLRQGVASARQGAVAGDYVDEHVLRTRLLAESSDRPLTHVIVTVGDRQSDPDGLWPADFDLFARLPGLERLDIVATEGVLTAGLLGRLHAAFPGIEEMRAGEPAAPPRLLVPSPGPGHETRTTLVSRDREEELTAIARRVKAEQRLPGASRLDRVALIVHRPLPYLYLARDVFAGAGIPFETLDTLPLAAEPYAGAVDLVLEWVISDFTRQATVALLRSPHFQFGTSNRLRQGSGESAEADDGLAAKAEGVPSEYAGTPKGVPYVPPEIAEAQDEVLTSAIASLDVALAEARYLGGLARFRALLSGWIELDKPAFAEAPTGKSAAATALAGRRMRATSARAVPAAQIALAAAEVIAPLAEERPMVDQIERLLGFLQTFDRPPAADDPDVEGRRQRVRGAVVGALVALSSAYRQHDPTATADAVALSAAVRRWLGARTFAARTGTTGLQIVDAQAARYGTFDDVQLVGLIDGDWPERARRPVFFPSSLMSKLEPVSADPEGRERDAAQAARASFVDLLRSSHGVVRVSTVLLENDAVVEPSMLLDEIPGAGLVAATAPPLPSTRIFQHEAMTLTPHAFEALPAGVAAWARTRTDARDNTLARFRGAIGRWRLPRISVSRLERYLDCPFRFYASEVLALEEEPEDEDTRTPLERGRFLHELFEEFFAEWQHRGHRRIDIGNINDARAVFAAVCERKLSTLSPSEAALERVRLEGSAVSPGIAYRVFEMEAERPEVILERLLEYAFEGEFTFHRDAGESRTIVLRGKVDRIDLLENGAIRVIDYKSKKTPDLKQALQLPVYSLCARERLQGRRGRNWTIGEAAYLSFEGEKAIVQLRQRDQSLDQLITAAEGRLLSTLDAIESGTFPPRPAKKSLCTTCAFSAVCRKEWVEAADE
jgi:RecB family exonuclease